VDSEDVRIAVYDHFRRGQTPSVATLAAHLSVPPEQVRTALATLAQQRHLALGADGEITMAHPFTSLPLGFSAMGRSTLWWGGCAWDSFAIPHLVEAEPEVLVATRCPGCGQPHALVVNRTAPPEGVQVAHFLVPAARMWDDVLHTCGNQRLFCCESCVDAWLAETGQAKGAVLDLVTLWRLARGWYAGRLERGYRRREPDSAAAYFAEAGLTGPFWAGV
jgi:hypothetical protein